MSEDNNLAECCSTSEHSTTQLTHDDDSSGQSTHPSNPQQISEQCVSKSSQLQEGAGSVTYGELVILGYNGKQLGEQSIKYVLRQRPEANGVKKSSRCIVENPHNSELVSNVERHAVCHPVSDTESVIHEYMADKETDMFQIGRLTGSPIDFTTDTKVHDGKDTNFTISRFACRILISRKAPFNAKVFAAAFDSNRNIFLGRLAIKQEKDGVVDGFTTNGILVMHPKGSFSDDPKPGDWREVSVGGDIYPLRITLIDPPKRKKITEETNDLQDGTLIDLCGVTLLWRSAEGLERGPTAYYLEGMVDKLNASKPMCPVDFTSLNLSKDSTIPLDDKKQLCVYLKCGHVQGPHKWGRVSNELKRCPICRQVGLAVRLRIGIQPSFYVDPWPPTFAFRPCGHAASEKTVKYWASVSIPDLTCDSDGGACPFCLKPLRNPGFVKLVFPDHIKWE